MIPIRIKRPSLFSVLFLTSILSLIVQPSYAAGTLSAIYEVLPSNSVVDLTAQGTLDWVHWGLSSTTSVDRKASVTPRIGSFTPIIVGTGEEPHRFDDNFNG